MPAVAHQSALGSLDEDLAAARNDIVMISRLLRHSAGGKNVSIAQRHYLGRSDNLLRAAVDEAFEPYGEILEPAGAAVLAPVRAATKANALGGSKALVR